MVLGKKCYVENFPLENSIWQTMLKSLSALVFDTNHYEKRNKQAHNN